MFSETAQTPKKSTERSCLTPEGKRIKVKVVTKKVTLRSNSSRATTAFDLPPKKGIQTPVVFLNGGPSYLERLKNCEYEQFLNSS